MFLGLPDLHPDPLVRGTDPRILIRIRTKMSRIRNTAENTVINVNWRNMSLYKKITYIRLGFLFMVN
jgi:hypothetical protein